MYKFFLCWTVVLFLGNDLYSQNTLSYTLQHDGKTRKYNLYVPASYNSSTPVPLVINLHGYTSNKEQQQEYSKFDNVADTANIIVCYPDATPDPIAQQLCWNFGIFGFNTDDVGFLETLVTKISQDYSIDQERIYGCGISAGATMCYYMACHSDLFTAIGSVAGAMSRDLYNSCVPTYSMPVIDFRGTNDGVGAWDGDINTQGIEDIIQFWVNENECDSNPIVTMVPDIDHNDGAFAEHFLYKNGINEHTIEFFKIHGGGHTWPKGTVNIMGIEVPYPNGNTCMDVDATAEMWRFFSQYPKLDENSLSISKEEFQFKIYPNPSNDFIHIHTNSELQTEIIISDLLGNILERTKNNTIDLSGYPSGIYMLKIGTFTKKFIVSK